MTQSPRTEAVHTVARVLADGAYSNIELSNGYNGSDADALLYRAIVMTVLERKLTLDYVIRGLTKKEPDEMTYPYLYVGAAQILFMDKIPDSAACNETVDSAKKKLDSVRCGFINAVLRNICRSKVDIINKIASAPDTVKYSLDKSICKLIRRQYDNPDEIFESVFNRRSLYLRPNTLKTDADGLVSFLAENGVQSEKSEYGVRVIGGRDKAVSLANTGLFFVQGLGSQYAVSLLDAKPSMTVVDVCACPGGKSLGAAIDMQNKGKIYAFDIHGSKFSLLESRKSILGVDIIEARENDSRYAVEELKEKADRVICDVPCSSLGVIGTKPEIRYRVMHDTAELIELQGAIFDSAVTYLKKGGVAVYSTCTVNKEENRFAVERFLEKHKELEFVTDRQFTVNDGAFDGFYACKIIKKG